MSGIYRHTLTERSVLHCELCRARWESEPHASSWSVCIPALRPAFDAGWRVYRGKRSQFTYCPEHGPKAPMTLVYPLPVTL